MLNVAGEAARNEGIKNVETRVMNAEALPCRSKLSSVTAVTGTKGDRKDENQKDFYDREGDNRMRHRL
jgi:hypothetical protein